MLKKYRFIASLLIIACFVFSTGIVTAGELVFKDVTDDHWAKQAIAEMKEQKIINGFPDGTFKPDNPISRAEFAKIITVAFDLKPQERKYSDVFKDVMPGDWFVEYIDSAAPYLTYWETSNGYYYKPNDVSVREDIAVALIVSAKLYNLPLKNPRLLEESFTDADKVSPRLRSTVAKAIENGLIQGFPDRTFRPQDPVTRAEASLLLSRTMQLKKKISRTTEPEETEDEPEPTLELFKPEKIDDKRVIIKGRTEKGNTVFVDGKLAYVNYDGTFEVSINLRPGKNIIKTQAYNRSGKMVYKDSVIEVEEPKPVNVKVKVPDEVTEPIVEVVGYVDDPTATLLVNERKLSVNYDGYFNTKVALKPGSNIVVFKTISSDGVENKVVRYVNYKEEEPDLKVDVPQKVKSNTADIYGSINDINAIIYINDMLVRPNVNGTFKATIDLKPGNNIVIIKAIGSNGLESKVIKNIECIDEKIVPEFNITAPSKVNENKLILTGYLIKACDYVYVNGNRVASPSGGSGTFLYDLSGQLKEGRNTFRIKAVSVDGLITEKDITVEFIPQKEEELKKEKNTESNSTQRRIIRNKPQDTEEQKIKEK